MEKHRLFKSADSSLQLNSSSDDSRNFGKDIRENPKLTSNAGMNKSSTPQRRSLRRPQTQTSVPQGDAGLQGTKVNKQSTAKVEKQSTTTQADIPFSVKHISDSDSDSKSDSDPHSDSMRVAGFFSSSSQKLPYSSEEDEEILRYILKGQCIFRKNPKRTYQSLKNRFMRNIKPKLFTTYRHLIPDEETVQKILMKFPELKKDVGKKETLTQIKLPVRIPSSKMLWEHGTHSETFEAGQSKFSDHLPMPSTSRAEGNELNFHRKVEVTNDSLTVLVNLNFEHPPPKTKRIYERYLNLKLKNKLPRCSACGRSGGPDLRPDSGAESDSFISNSVESKASESPPKKKIFLWKTKTFQSPKRKKRNFVPEPCDDRRSCSPSLLIDVNEVDELGEDSKKETLHFLEPSNSDASVKERDSVLEEPEVVSKDTDSIYENAVADFRNLIDSEEEEMLVKKCLRKNSKTIGFNPNMSVEEVHVDSYFIRSSSPGPQSPTASESPTGSAQNRIQTRSISGASLAKNMMNMLAKTN